MHGIKAIDCIRWTQLSHSMQSKNTIHMHTPVIKLDRDHIFNCDLPRRIKVNSHLNKSVRPAVLVISVVLVQTTGAVTHRFEVKIDELYKVQHIIKNQEDQNNLVRLTLPTSPLRTSTTPFLLSFIISYSHSDRAASDHQNNLSRLTCR